MTKVLKVTIDRYYHIPMLDEERTNINGWSIEEVKKDWFERTDIIMSHATRDGHRFGNTDKIKNIKTLTYEEFEEEMK